MTLLDFAAIAPWVAIGVAFAFELYEGLDRRRAMSFWVLPPEINSARLYAGPGSAPLMSAATAWDTLSSALYSTAAEAGAAVGAIPWSGPSAAAMRAAWTRHQAWLLSTAASAERTATQARTGAAAYETARAASAHPALVAANRAQTAALIATNWLGQNTAAIAALETEYAQMWAQDVAAMSAYLAQTQAALNALTPFDTAGLWDYLLGGQTLPAVAWTTLQSNVSSGPWQSVTDLLALFTVFWGVSAGTGPNSPLAQIFHATLTPPPPAVVSAPPPTTPLPRTTPIRASVGTANRAAGLSMPRTDWAAPTPAPSRAPAVRPIAPQERDTPIPIPLPVALSHGGSPARQQRPEPDYRLRMRFVPRPPSGG